MKRLILPIMVGVLLIIAGCGGSTNKAKPEALDTSTLTKDLKDESAQKKAAEIHPGKKVYAMYCATCHQADGSGVPGMYPPLYSSEYIEDKDKIIEVVLNGLTGEIEVDGEVYNNMMAPHSHLTDLELANVISYVRASFGNEFAPVTKEDIVAGREKKN